LQVAPVGCPGERGDLRTGIVDIILLGDVVTGLGEQVGKRIANHRTSTVPDMHGACGIGRHVFNIDPRAVANGTVAVGGAGTEDVGKQGTEC
jgi:hypothetical protein